MTTYPLMLGCVYLFLNLAAAQSPFDIANAESKNYYEIWAEAKTEQVQAWLQTSPSLEAKASNGQTVLMYASEYSTPEIVKLLLEAGAEVNTQTNNGETALGWATSIQDIESIKYEILTNSNRALPEFVLEPSKTETVLALIEAGADVNAMTTVGNTPLISAVLYRDIEIVGALLEAGADVNAQFEDRDRALTWAVRYGESDMLNLLLNAGADVNARGTSGQTALSVGVEYGVSKDVVNSLLAAGADVNLADDTGQTPLMLAGLNGNDVIVRALLGAGANINHADNKGYTVLMNAASSGHSKTVRDLIQAGADVHAKNSSGKGAIDYAKGAVYWQLFYSTYRTLLITGAVLLLSGLAGVGLWLYRKRS